MVCVSKIELFIICYSKIFLSFKWNIEHSGSFLFMPVIDNIYADT